MGKKFMGYDNASELITAIGNKIKAKYTKPSEGIPKSDLASGVQTSLGKADSAVQTETDPTVPTWAKQTNKPSYTQDEVPDGTTYKRVTQTEKNAWSGKQNALTTTQMQAVNSGINSTKVSQISTNQTNILYVANKIGKNLLSRSTLTRAMAPWLPIEPIKAGNYVVSANIDTAATNWAVSFRDENDNSVCNCTGIGYSTLKNGVSATFTGTATQIKFWYANGATDVDAENAMVCTPEAWNISHTYEPYALPNSDLTYLEAEDRAALAEEIDAGAKNVAPVASLTKSSPGSTDQINISLSVGTTYVIAFDYTATDASELVLRKDNGTDISISPVFNGTGKYYKEYTVTDNIKSYYMYTNGSATISNLLLCTKAAFCISPKFVPYRPSYQALVDKTTEQTFGIFKYNNNYSINTVTRKCNGFAWFTLSATSTANITANTNTIIAYVDGDVQPVGGSTDRFIFTARVNTDPPSLLHSHIRGGDGYIYINSPTAIPAGTSISITGSYKY